MAKKTKPKKNPSPLPRGRPSEYRPEYCQQLIDYMRQGNSFHLFGQELDPPVWSQTLFNWAEAHPDFLEAKRKGEEASERWWLNVLKAGATGQLTRTVKKEPALDKDGNPILDAKGNVVMVEQKEAATFNATATVFALKNKFPQRWRDRKEVEVAGKDGGPIRMESMTKSQARTTLKKVSSILKAHAEDEEDEEG